MIGPRFFSFLFLALFGGLPAQAIELQCSHLQPIQMRFLQRHVYFTELNKNLEVRTVDQFVKNLDSSKLYFTEADVQSVKKIMNGVFEKTRGANCLPIMDTYNLLKVRVREASAFARAHLAKDFKFDKATKLILDADKRGFPKTVAEAQAFWKKYIQLQIANYLATGETEASAKEKVIKNYDRAVKRVEEEEPWDILATYLDSFASALDPHTNFWSKSAFEDFETSIRLSLEGIGATLSSRDGLTVIEELVPGGAAFRSGQLQSKDIIMAVAQGDGGAFEDVLDQDLRDVVRKIRGKKGTKVRLSILRKDGDQSKKFQVTLIRDKVSLEDEAAFVQFIDKEVDGKKLKVALLNLPQFYADNKTNERSSAGDIKKLLRKIREEKADTVVFDLSTNGGGSLQDAVEIAGQFFREGNVVKQSSKDLVADEVTLFDKDPMVDWAGPMVVLTSRVTASASEIVSGTLQTYQRAVVIGSDHTFGKGTVQTVEDLPQKLGALKTTIGLYFIPSGHSTQHSGVASDVIIPSVLTTEDTGEKTLDYSLPPKKIARFSSKEAFVPEGEIGGWKKITPATIKVLQEKSQKRVAVDPEFKKVREDIEKAKKRTNGEILVGDFLRDKEDANKEEKSEKGKSYEATRASRKERYLKRADIQEAINIAADLALLQGGGVPVKIGSKGVGKDSAANVNPNGKSN